MTRDWEKQLRDWSSPPGKTEETRCDNAISAIKNAIAQSDALKSRSISVFSQGSYRNNTNVRKDSDVDIGIICLDTFFYEITDGTPSSEFGIVPATYHYLTFKSDVEKALKSYFGEKAVTRGNKAFDVHETSYHVEADVAPFFEHRRYSRGSEPLKGVELKPDSSETRVINWPEQHYANGVQKNRATGTRYKSIVRALKALSSEMEGQRIAAAKVPGFLIECLVWNVPNENFSDASYLENVRRSLISLYHGTKEDAGCSDWGEVSELKYLFRGPQKWSRQQANDFIVAAWTYLGLK